MTPRLVAELDRIDDGRLPIAEVNRRLGRAADRLGLPRPSYERVRVLVHELRATQRRPSTLELVVGISMRTRPPDALVVQISRRADLRHRSPVRAEPRRSGLT
jgi:hypothetical protein